ncbi:MAG: hypothetical protein HGA37_16725, partial [Lentimicrobium sp.]|nr:hypothetical protein [Lentimicrobium sp.]
MSKFIQPTLGQPAFHCPHCGVLAEQTWSETITCYYQGKMPNGVFGNTGFSLPDTLIAKCKHCEKLSIWIDKKMVYPSTGNVEPANVDLP